jgi:HD superfamily phosphodiesterase
MNLTVKFESAELHLKQILEDFFISVYDEKTLFSHGIEHHRRVWNYAKELAVLIDTENKISDSSFIPKLIITCYLHDIGMSVDPGIRHGHHSKDLCIRFLHKNSLDQNKYKDVLSAIENHDNKEYKTSVTNNDLLKILSIADDLDAFGYMGIYRYSEIYLERGVKPQEIGHLIRVNAAKRFKNFIKIFGFADEYVEKHKKRYEILDNFFNEYNKQAVTYKFGTALPVGYCGVIEAFNEMTHQKGDLKDAETVLEKYSNDPAIHRYFSELVSETEIH